MDIRILNKLMGAISVAGLCVGSASGAMITATDTVLTPAAGIQTELSLTIEDTQVSGLNQFWGNVLLRIDGAMGSPGSGDNFTISVFEEDVASNDVVFSTNITGSALSFNNGWWEFSAN
jgi:hypothetical protein